jgi:hypothetical protein
MGMRLLHFLPLKGWPFSPSLFLTGLTHFLPVNTACQLAAAPLSAFPADQLTKQQYTVAGSATG